MPPATNHGLRTGTWSFRDEKGRLVLEGDYEAGHPIGKWKRISYTEEQRRTRSGRTSTQVRKTTRVIEYEFVREETPDSDVVWEGSRSSASRREGLWRALRPDGSPMLTVHYPIPIAEESSEVRFHQPDGTEVPGMLHFLDDHPEGRPALHSCDLAALPRPPESPLRAEVQRVLKGGQEGASALNALRSDPLGTLDASVALMLEALATSPHPMEEVRKIHEEVLAGVLGRLEPWPEGRPEAVADLVGRWSALRELAHVIPEYRDWFLQPTVRKWSLLVLPGSIPYPMRDSDARREGLVFGSKPDDEESARHRRYIENVDRALRWLADAQNPDGSWGTIPGDASEDDLLGATAMAVLAFHGNDVLPQLCASDGYQRKAVSKGCIWLLRHLNDPGPTSSSGPDFSEILGRPEGVWQLAKGLEALAETVFFQKDGARLDPAVLQPATSALIARQLADGSWPARQGSNDTDTASTLEAVWALGLCLDTADENTDTTALRAAMERALDWIRGHVSPPPGSWPTSGEAVWRSREQDLLGARALFVLVMCNYRTLDPTPRQLLDRDTLTAWAHWSSRQTFPEELTRPEAPERMARLFALARLLGGRTYHEWAPLQEELLATNADSSELPWAIPSGDETSQLRNVLTLIFAAEERWRYATVMLRF